MKKRNQINVNLEEFEAFNINEYCKAHNMTPQTLFKVGAQKLIEEDILQREIDAMTLQSWFDMKEGRVAPIDDILELLKEDEQNVGEMTKLSI
ncbi:MAG TPA: hypothetical protein DCZ75_12970 [Geobacter sp.]|nr:hypothetical protein [Geobacter sp.]